VRGLCCAAVWRSLLQFTLLGFALFAADRLWWSGGPPPPVVIPAERVAALRGELTRTLGRAPTPEEIDRALGPEVDDELLFREALSRGYERDDPVVYRRLVQNLRFAGAPEEQDDDALFEQALAMGMHETDVVARRRMIQRLRLDLEAAAPVDPPDQRELRAAYESDPERYRAPARTRLTQLYFRGEHEERARRVLARLMREGTAPDDAREAGEPFLHPAQQPPQSHRELADRFGASFADGVDAAPVGAWSGPIASAYGVHLVWVQEREPERALPLEEVRESLVHAVRAERRREALERALAALRRDVSVEVASAPTG
jgi:PPIC-type PPIASE domain